VTADNRGMAYRVIVHPAGQLEPADGSRYWTEVPSLPSCLGDGDTIEQALDRTRAAIAAARGQAEAGSRAPTVKAVELDVELAL
jgi:predicted RNase H-like HicB family nuclease